MCGHGMLVHCLGGLGAAISIEAAELSSGDRVLTEWTLESTEAVHHCHGVISHDFKCSALMPPNQSYPCRRVDPSDSGSAPHAELLPRA
jgi:hypothetical protein